MSSIRLENITKRFGDNVVLRDINLEINDGEFFTFLGPSGCGKSTLLNIIAGLEEVSTGRILFDDQDVTGLPPARRDVAMVFQSYALYPHMTVFDNIAFPLKIKRFDRERIRREVERVASVLGLEELLDRKPRELSGGQRQRVALGRAMVRNPRVFLMDEPLSNLDARLRIEMRSELKRLHRRLGTTMVYVTHDQAEAMALSDRIAILNNSIIQQCADPLSVYSEPSNTFVARFIGTPPMNLIEARVRAKTPPVVELGRQTYQIAGLNEIGYDRVLLGIRPEDVVIKSSPDGGFEATVEIVEPEGARYLLDILFDGIMIKAVSEKAFGSGEKLYIEFPRDRVHLFAPHTGERINPPPDPTARENS
ncbi:MAG TPA: ABC transporter ATP-binding protein [Nitrospirae bacterium]|nr:ABC transporter ATP-binding protein [Nitrospirota bacterium]